MPSFTFDAAADHIRDHVRAFFEIDTAISKHPRLLDRPASRWYTRNLRQTRVADLAERITVDSEQCGGRPCIRGLRIRVSDVLDLLANGLTSQQVLEELPDLEPEDISACLRFASRRLDHPVVAA